MWLGVLLLTALAADVKVAVAIDAPNGRRIVEEEVELPWKVERRAAFDSRDHILRLSLSEVDGDVQLRASMSRLRGSKEKLLVSLSNSFEQGQLQQVRVEQDIKKQRKPVWKVEMLARPESPAPGRASRSVPYKRGDRFYLLWDDAPLREDVARDAPARFRNARMGQRADATTQATLWQSVGPWSGRLREVMPLAANPAIHCHQGSAPFRLTRRTAFTDLEHLAPLTTSEAERSFDDGTGFAIGIGVPVAELEDEGGYRIRQAGVTTVVDLPRSHIGVEYQPTSRYMFESTDMVVMPDENGVVGTIGGREVRASGPVNILGFSGVREPVVTIRNACVDLRVRTRPEQLKLSGADAATSGP